MGSSQSQPSRTSPPSPPPPPRRRSNNPLSSIRRLSTLGRRGPSPDASTSTSDGEPMQVERTTSSGGGKRSRQGSTAEGHTNETERKKARVGEAEAGSSGDVSMADASEYNTPQPAEPYPQPGLAPPVSTAGGAPMSPVGSHDSLAEERMSTIDTIRSTLGPDWPLPDTPSAAEVERLTRRQLANRTEEPSSFSSGPSQPPPTGSSSIGGESVLRTHDSTDPHVAEARASLQRATAQAQLLADRIATLSQQLNRIPSPSSSRPSSSSSRPASLSQAPTPNQGPAPAPAVGSSREGMMRHLHRRLNDARSQLRDTERQLDATRERLDTGGARRRRVPTGAVLVIQGLAQTQGVGEEAPGSGNGDIEDDVLRDTAMDEDTPAQARPRERRASEGDSRPPSGSREERQDASLESQARMIGGLLTVAAAATATTLLAPGGNRPSLASALAPPRPSPSSTLESLLHRIRPNRQEAAERQEVEERDRAQSVEASLGTYLRNVLRDNRVGSTSSSSSPSATATSPNPPTQASEPTSASESTPNTNESAEEAEEAISSGFQRFLEDLQVDLAVAVREFAGPLPVAPNVEASEETGPQDTAEASMDIDQEPVHDTTSTPPNPTSPRPPPSSEPPIPSFHPQLAQNQPSTSSSSTRPTAPQAVTGGYDGVPRRMNFFRAHMFPAIDAYTARAVEGPLRGGAGAQPSGQGEQSSSSAASPNNPQNASSEGQAESSSNAQEHAQPQPEPLIPTIFVGVRNIRHDALMSTEDLVSHPNFPFVNGEVPARDVSAEAGSSLREGEGGSVGGETVHAAEEAEEEDGSVGGRDEGRRTRASSAPPARQSLRERIFSHLRRPQIIPVSSPSTSPNTSSHSTSNTAATINTYLIYIIGANYPPAHPILRMPSLVHGGEMSDEELRLVGDILGPVKAPTVAKGDIEKSGLRVVKGGDMKKEGEAGRVLESCAERCLVCLSDYEPEEDCRILACRHAFHQDCVDHWLTQGRNSCPACRAEAVETKPSWSAQEATAPQAPEVPLAAAAGTSASTTTRTNTLDELD
ncbi:hypothetical protein L202_08451 [Cryptococcus amylolentus CBS 6039]|uniref:RING-type domain-containing protein n=2 Tax=Cryptococcus amylolentus TaxID=104669 RepID=A0A1E3HB96_9TREE|nr:hypothetical protein L202_08451 [Cryptococcus amylolentus CBS 6039]ODN73056.1 hypothetical protein L202_08451 [Cryptococcus amylolentus CBS 6039]ODN98211.1 hypothetical protein I350_07857 [Cryptococcus amylolentus CBS 6273]